MALLINDELIWVSIPKCASMSIEKGLLESNLKIKKWGREVDPIYSEIRKNNRLFTYHIHIPVNELYQEFGKKETVCVTRDWFDRWLSALNFIWDEFEYYIKDFKLVSKWEELDNETIYKIMDKSFLDSLHSIQIYDEKMDKSNIEKCIANFLYNKNDIKHIDIKNFSGAPGVLISEKYWKSNTKCTYEFDVKELDKFCEFIEKKFGEKIEIPVINKSSKRTNKIIKDDRLKNFIWQNFECRYNKSNRIV